MESENIHAFAELISPLLTYNNLLALFAMLPIIVFLNLVWQAGSKKEEDGSLQKTSFKLWWVDAYVALFAGVAIYGLNGSMIRSLFATLFVANFYMNLAYMQLMHGSFREYARQEGKNKTIVSIFFGWEIIIVGLLTEEEDDDEEWVPVPDKQGRDYYKLGVIAIVLSIVGMYFYWWHTFLSLVVLVYIANASFFFSRSWRIDKGCGFWRAVLHLAFLSNLCALLTYYGIRAMQTKQYEN